MDIKIFVSCHKPTKIIDNELLIPIEVGSANHKEHIELDRIVRDDEGDNISYKNPYFCELTAQYWAWKNADADYYGFFHYRRYLNFSDRRYQEDAWQSVIEERFTADLASKYGWTEENMTEVIEGYDLIIPEERNVSRFPSNDKNIYEQYRDGNQLHIKDLDTVRDIIAERHPEYIPTYDSYIRGNMTCLCNMYVMKKPLFDEYMSWLFDILFEFERRADMSDYSTEGLRTPGHLAERLFNVFCRYKKSTDGSLKIKELQTVQIMDTELKPPLSKIQKTAPAFQEKNVAIALASNDWFAPYMATALQSLMAASTPDHNYDIIILTQNMSKRTKDLLAEQFGDRANMSIRYADPTVLIEDYESELYICGHFSKETYYRLVLPELLPLYDKILYLDSDLIAKADVAELYDTDVEGCLLAACHDADTAGLYNGWQPDKKEYTDNVLKLKEPYQYFQAGVLLLNLEEFRRTYTTKEIMEFANSQQWQLLDQDILNKLCEGRVRYVDMSWNVMVDYAGIRINEIIGRAPKWLVDMYAEARKHMKIIHYAGPEKPWDNPEMDMGTVFWRYARDTVFYEIMMLWMSTNRQKTAVLPHGKGGIIRGSIQCVLDHGLMYTFRYALYRLLNRRA